MVITELAGHNMSDKEIFEVLVRSCERWGFKLVKANFKRYVMELTVLVEGPKESKGAISMDMDAIMVGYMNPLTFESIDADLNLEPTSCCPNTIVMVNAELYEEIVEDNGGVNYANK